MTTFAAESYSSAHYASFRPTYPSSLFTGFLLPYHHGALCTLIDLGCGPGTVTRPLSYHFTRTIGTDPSAGMLETARSLTPSSKYPSITYRAASAENLSFLADDEVDMVVAAQAAHWFDHDVWWAEMGRVVRRGGTVAAWGYRDFLFPQFPRASRILRDYSYGKDKMGPYWSQPGRSIVEDRLRSVRPPLDAWEDVLRWEYEPEFEVPTDKDVEREVRRPVLEDDSKDGFGTLVRLGEGLMRKTMELGAVENYIRTWSCTHAWKEKHPEAGSRSEGGSRDIVDELMEKMGEAEGWGSEWREMKTDIAWGHGVILARKR